MDNRLQQETERQRRILQEARKAVEAEKERLRHGGTRKEPRLDEPPAPTAAPHEPRSASVPAKNAASQNADGTRIASQSNNAVRPDGGHTIRVRSIPDIRSALISLDENQEGAGWSKPFSLPKADVEPWLSFLRGYRESCLFPYAASADHQPGRELEVDAAVQALFELKQIDLRIVLDPAVQINDPVEYIDDDMQQESSDAAANELHDSMLAKAVEKGRKMGNRLYDALLGDGYTHLAQAWEKVYGRKPTVSELHSMLTTGRVKPAAEGHAPGSEAVGNTARPTVQATAAGGVSKNAVGARERKDAIPSRALPGAISRLSENFGASIRKFKFPDKRKLIFHLCHAVVIVAAIAAYFLIMHVID